MLALALLSTLAWGAAPAPHLQAGDHLFMGGGTLSLVEEARLLTLGAQYERLVAMGSRGSGVGLGGQLAVLWTPYDSLVGLGPRATGWFGAASPVTGFVGGGAVLYSAEGDRLASLVGHVGGAIRAGPSAAVTLELKVDLFVLDDETSVVPVFVVGVLGVGRQAG